MLLLQHTISKIDGTDLNASSIVKSVDVLMAIRWIKRAWDDVKPDTIVNCFRHCGALPLDDAIEEDPFAGLDDNAALQELVNQFDPTTTVQEYNAYNADEGLDTCFTFDNMSECREQLRTLAIEEGPTKQTRVEEESEDDNDEEPRESSITSYSKALGVCNDYSFSSRKIRKKWLHLCLKLLQD